MPRGRKPNGEHALSNAERQARYRTRRLTQPAPTKTRLRHPTDRRSRPQRWRDAVSELRALQAEYADWLTALPDSLRDTPVADGARNHRRSRLHRSRRHRAAPRLRPGLNCNGPEKRQPSLHPVPTKTA